jgi:hypothetical protein
MHEIKDRRVALNNEFEPGVRSPVVAIMQPEEPECEHCQLPGIDHITRHGLTPVEILWDGSRVHRIVHLTAAEAPGKFIPCRRSTVQQEISRYAWTDNFAKTAPQL